MLRRKFLTTVKINWLGEESLEVIATALENKNLVFF
jgi:hypothetical protein